MFKDLTDYGSNCNAPVIIQISFITSMVFHDGNDSAKLELMRHKFMHQHLIEEALESLKDGQWSIKEMFRVYKRIVTCSAFLHTIDRINDVFKGNPMGGARTINMTSNCFTIFFVKSVIELVDTLLIVRLGDLDKMGFEGSHYTVSRGNAINYSM